MDTPRKIFASYAWSEERSEMVRKVCERLKGDNIEVVLDQWHLNVGDDIYHFMEQAVKDSTVTSVLIFCDKLYATKADTRTPSGVSTETQIISPQLYKAVSNSKFIPVICERDEEGKACCPTFVESRYFIDFSSDELINTSWEQLIRAIYGKPQFVEPPLGATPQYILDPAVQPRQSHGKFLFWKQAAAKSSPVSASAEKDYVSALTKDLQSLYLEPAPGKELDELLVEGFNSTLPIRDELLEVFSANAVQAAGRSGSGRIGMILDRLLQLRSPNPTQPRFPNDLATLNLFFYELFLYTIAQLLASEEYPLTASLLERPYPTAGHNRFDPNQVPTFRTFYTHSELLEHYNSKQKPAFQHYHAVLLQRRCTLEHLSLDQLIQADVVLAARAAARVKEDGRWYPRLLFRDIRPPVMPLFLQARQKEGFSNLALLLGVKDRQELAQAFDERITEGKSPASFWHATPGIASAIGLAEITANA